MTELTSREIVQRCIEFRDPPRIATHFDTLPVEGKRNWPESDFKIIFANPDPDVTLPENTDEWGLRYETLDPTGQDMGQVLNSPLGEDWEQLNTFQIPDFSKPSRYHGLKAQVDALHAQGKYVFGRIPALMTLPGEMRGPENWFADHLEEPEALNHLLDIIMKARMDVIEGFGNAGVDAVITWDDMGTNEGPMVNPKLFDTMYFPRYKQTCDALHERGMHLLHHCCGQVKLYMDRFIEAGCDVLQLDQPTLMGIDWLAENYGGKVCFWNPVDIQKTVGLGPEAVADEAHHQIWAFGNFGGGFMVNAYHQPTSIGMTIPEFEAMYATFKKYGQYPLVPYEPANVQA